MPHSFFLTFSFDFVFGFFFLLPIIFVLMILIYFLLGSWMGDIFSIITCEAGSFSKYFSSGFARNFLVPRFLYDGKFLFREENYYDDCPTFFKFCG